MRLNRSQILVQATAILDEYGLSDLSMRRLADSLGVKAGALYWHYSNKQTLLAAISDKILEGVVSTPASNLVEKNWQETLADWAKQFRRALLAHRDSADLVSSTRSAGLGEINPVDFPAGILEAGGIEKEFAVQGAAALCHFILGHVFEEQSRQQLSLLGLLDEEAIVFDDNGFEYGVRVFLLGMAVSVSK